MQELYKTKIEIEAWLNEYNIKNYQIIYDSDYGYVVDVNGNVELGHQKLKQIKVKFNIIQGDMDLSFNSLTNLLGCPRQVGSFNINENNLKSLNHGPRLVYGHYVCENNQLHSLEGAPRAVKTFMCSNNKLKNLKGAPDVINGYLLAENNLIDSLIFFPEQITGQTVIGNNPWTRDDAKGMYTWVEIYNIHLAHVAEAEKKLLDKKISTTNKEDEKSNKI